MTDTSFDTRQFMRRASNNIYNNALFIGDYVKLTAYCNTFLAAFTITNPPYGIGPVPPADSGFSEDFRNRQDVVFRKVKFDCSSHDENINMSQFRVKQVRSMNNAKVVMKAEGVGKEMAKR